MALYILLIFIFVPIVEIAVFIQLGSEIGLWNTVLLILLTAIIGTWLLKNQGMATLQRAQETIRKQVFPVTEVFDGLCLALAGVLLLTPGFVTDAVGFLLFFPQLRVILRTQIWTRLANSQNAHIWMNSENSGSPERENVNTIDGAFREVEPKDERPSTGKTGDHKLK
tara:strand:+ start:233 stop:736 length:504 start_codon:yes stop_codon:yes gene_type:complete